MQRPVTPLAITKSAYDLLKNVDDFQVVAFYASGLEVRSQKSGGSIFISTAKRGILPSHIILKQHDLLALADYCVVGDRVVFQAAMNAAFFQTVPISLSGRQLSLSIKPGKKCEHVSHLADCIIGFLNHRQGGLALPIAAMLEKDWPGRSAFMQGEAFSEEAVLWLLGRGQGSTPAGDDMLLGALATGMQCGWGTGLYDALKMLKPRFPERTTFTSALYLDYALQGIFSSHILSFVRALSCGGDLPSLHIRMNRLLSHGASSGCDTLMGCALMLSFWGNSNKSSME